MTGYRLQKELQGCFTLALVEILDGSSGKGKFIYLKFAEVLAHLAGAKIIVEIEQAVQTISHFAISLSITAIVYHYLAKIFPVDRIISDKHVADADIDTMEKNAVIATTEELTEGLIGKNSYQLF